MGQAVLKVALLAHTPQPELAAAMGGRLCYSDAHIGELKEAVRDRAEGFVDKLTALGHLSPIEHASFTFGVEGVSRALLAQLTRHRIASFSVQSQRYVKQDELSYTLPPSIAELGENASEEYAAQMDAIAGWYRGWLERGIPAEDARFVLPNAAETRLILTMNARELLHFFSLRCCNRAQWEIRRLAWSMLGIAQREAPALFKNGGPGCTGPGCTEGKMSCGGAGGVKAFGQKLFELAASGASDDEITDFVINNAV